MPSFSKHHTVWLNPSPHGQSSTYHFVFQGNSYFNLVVLCGSIRMYCIWPQDSSFSLYFVLMNFWNAHRFLKLKQSVNINELSLGIASYSTSCSISFALLLVQLRWFVSPISNETCNIFQVIKTELIRFTTCDSHLIFTVTNYGHANNTLKFFITIIPVWLQAQPNFL